MNRAHGEMIIDPDDLQLTGEPLTPEAIRAAIRRYVDTRDPREPEDHAALELVALAKRGDEAGFRDLAGCMMPAEEVEACWVGTRERLEGRG